MLKDIIEVIKISGLKGFCQLLKHSRLLKTYGRNFTLMNALIALEKCGVNKYLLSGTGLDISSQQDLDSLTLAAVCEYLHEINVLTKLSPGVYRAKNPTQFGALLKAMYACYAYHEPVQAMDKLLTKEYEYGQQVVRNDQYDAIASATLTSIFSYGLAQSVLKKVEVRALLDLGCGTGEFLFFLSRCNSSAKLYGADNSEKAIAQGRKAGFESEKVKLFVEDIFDLENTVSQIDTHSIDIVSFMFVLHEFEDKQIQTILKTIQDLCPQSKILLTELINKSSEEIQKARRSVFPELKFLHQFSKQMLRTPAEWKKLFSEVHLLAKIERTNQLTNHVCFLFTPD